MMHYSPSLRSYRLSVHAASPLITCLDPTGKVILHAVSRSDQLFPLVIYFACSPLAPFYASPRIVYYIDCADFYLQFYRHA